jgi:hypothetical protein
MHALFEVARNSLLFLFSLEAELDVNVLANRSGELGDAEFGSLHGQFGREARPVNAARKFGGFAAAQQKGHWMRGAVQGEVAGHFESVFRGTDSRAFEGDDGELLGVEKIRTTQVIVALSIVGVDAFGLRGQLERAIRWILTVEGEMAGKVVEPAVHPRKTEVREFKGHSRVIGVDYVFLGLLAACQAGSSEGKEADDQTDPKLRSHRVVPVCRIGIIQAIFGAKELASKAGLMLFHPQILRD